MGYSVNIKASTVFIARENEQEALDILRATYNEVPSKTRSLSVALERLEFNVDEKDDGISIDSWDSEKGDPTDVLRPIAHLLTGYFVLYGDDGERWSHSYDIMPKTEYIISVDTAQLGILKDMGITIIGER